MHIAPYVIMVKKVRSNMKFIDVYVFLAMLLILVVCFIINTWLGVGFVIGSIGGFILPICTLTKKWIYNRNEVIETFDSFGDKYDEMCNND